MTDPSIAARFGLQPGRYARFSGIPSHDGLHLSSTAPNMPLEIYRGVQKDKDDADRERETGKHLIALFTLLLE